MGGAAPTLESNYWFGAQGNRLWAGQVEGDGYELIDTREPFPDLDSSNRVKVRIMGYHTRSRSRLPSRDLPWATIMMPTTESVTRNNAGIVHGLENGMWVIGTFLDGESAQQPLVLGSIGITDKGQTFDDKMEMIGGGNNNIPKNDILRSRSNNKPENSIGIANRGGPRGGSSANSARQTEDEQQVIGVANGKCGNRPENEFARILQDLFKFVSRNEKLGDLFVDKLTGNITSSIRIVYSYIGRLVNSVNGILGDIKALVVSEVKKYIQKIFAGIIIAIQLPNKRGVAVTVGGIFIDTIMEAIKCLFKTLLDKISSLIVDIVTTLVDDVVNTAFCQISNILKGITQEIQDGIASGLEAISQFASVISDIGNFGGSFLAKIGDLIAQFCDGDLSCSLGITEVETGVGPKPDNAIDTFFNRIETFGGLPTELNVGLFGSDSFLSSLNDVEIRGSDGEIVSGSLNCSGATEFKFPMIPNLFFTGLQNELNKFKFEFDSISLNGGGTNTSGTNGSGSDSTGTNGSGSDSTGTNGSGTNGSGTNGSGTNGSGTNGTGSDSTGTNGSGSNTKRPTIFDDNPYPPSSYDGKESGPGSKDSTPRAIPVINRKGKIISAKVTNPGFGLTSEPNLTISPMNGWGSGAFGSTILNRDGGVDSIVITKGGGGYPYFDKSVSTANFVSTLEDGNPDYSKINGIYSENPFWLGAIIKKFPPIVTKTGSGYGENCVLVVEPGPDETNEVILPVLKPIITNGFLTGVEVEEEGFGFTVLPVVYIAGGGTNLENERKAVILPILEFFPRKDASIVLSNYNKYKTIIDCVGHPGE